MNRVGLVMLIGIMAKNGILVVEFAEQRRDRGLAVRAAIETAARVRLRPIVTTMISTVLGGLPRPLLLRLIGRPEHRTDSRPRELCGGAMVVSCDANQRETGGTHV